MSEKDPLTEPWKQRGMDQLCSKLHPEADKGCTDAGDRLPFAEKQFHTENRNYSHNFCLCANLLTGVSGWVGAIRRIVPNSTFTA